MSKILSCAALFALLFSSFVAQAQFKNVVVEQVENEGKVPGKTYRIYAVLTDPKDQVFVVFGDSLHKMEIKSTKPFYQDPKGGALAKDSNKKEVTESETLKYDSWVTIGATDNYFNNTTLLNINLDDFEKKGAAIIAKDGAWFCTPMDQTQAVCGEDRKVLLMQFTTQGVVSGKFNVMGKTASGESYTNYDVQFSTEQGKK